MTRRAFLQTGSAVCLATPVLAAWRSEGLEGAAGVLTRATAEGLVAAATMHVRQRETTFTRVFGQAQNEGAMFLLGSISKLMSVTALMTLFDQGAFQLGDPVQKFLPQFKGDQRAQVTMQHLLTHVSGLPDQLPENDALRRSHAPLSAFVEKAVQTPLSFTPGSQFQYSSMAILLAAHVAEILSGTDILTLVNRAVFAPLKMQHSVQGLGTHALGEMVQVQTEHAAPEAGGGDPTAKEWDWNSPYWRHLGAPWGGTHASAPDIATYLASFLHETGEVVKPVTARLMVKNHNATGLTPRGLGFSLGQTDFGPDCSEKTFGHTGSTGTIAWTDPATQTICVVLTSLPARAVKTHPRNVASLAVAAATKG